MTGARDVWIASDIVWSLTCERSTSMPTRFISSTTCRPKSDRPRWEESVDATAQSSVRQWVSVMYRTPRRANIRSAPSEFSIAWPPSIPIKHETLPAAKLRSTAAAVVAIAIALALRAQKR